MGVSSIWPAAIATLARVARPGSYLLATVLIGLGLLPLWAGHYLPIYDYPNHLLEAHVVSHYDDPALAYSRDYLIRPGWYLHSNALTTLQMIGLSYLLPSDLAGRLTLSLYVVLLVGGMALLLRQTGRPRWLLLATPALAYNLTFTAGMLNWSYGAALTPWLLVAYLRWRATAGRRWLAALAALLLLIYTAHVLAWGLALLILYVLAAADNLPSRGWLALGLVPCGAVPLLMAGRPALAVAPLLMLVGCWGTAVLVRRLRLSGPTLASLGLGGALTFLGLIKLFKPQLLARFPDVDYSMNSKLVALPRLLAFSQHELMIDWRLVGLNSVLLALYAAIGLIFLRAALSRPATVDQQCWRVVIGALLLAFLVMPYRTADIIVIEPRVLLLAALLLPLAVPLPVARSAPGRVLIGLYLALAVCSGVTALGVVRSYDATASNWAQTIRQLPPASRVLVLSFPIQVPESGAAVLARASQIFDGNQFSAVYALEEGGFVANTFFNGPLLARRPEYIPPYWWLGFQPEPWLRERCADLPQVYDAVLLWNASDQELDGTLRACGATLSELQGPLAIWQLP